MTNFLDQINSDNSEEYLRSLKDKNKEIQLLKRRTLADKNKIDWITHLEDLYKKTTLKK